MDTFHRINHFNCDLFWIDTNDDFNGQISIKYFNLMKKMQDSIIIHMFDIVDIILNINLKILKIRRISTLKLMWIAVTAK